MNERLLDLRARKLAERITVPEHRAALGTLALVRSGTERIGIPVAGLREIVRPPPITTLPRQPVGMPGIIQIRGELMSVVNLAIWLGLSTESEPEHLAVVESKAGLLGLLVGEPLGFRELFREELTDVGAENGFPLTGRTNDLVLVLDLQRLFSDPRLLIEARTPPLASKEKAR